MTGYGKAECTLSNMKLTIEIKSLNSKQVDTSTKLPAIFRDKEAEIRQLLASKLERGKIDCAIHYEVIEGTTAHLNSGVIRDYYNQLNKISVELGIGTDDLLSTILRLPDTVVTEKNQIEDEEWNIVKQSLTKAIGELDAFRIQEGKTLETDLENRTRSILERLDSIEPFEKERIEKLKERISSNLEELIKKEDIDRNRFEQELIYYLEKLDITEEKVRLKNHCGYFLETLQHPDSNGKKLGFITQEMGREINTLGSKANHAGIQKLVVEMKDDLEKIKEQVLNVL